MRTFFLGCLLALTLATPAQARLLAADRINEPQSLLPYCSWLFDAEGRHTIENIASGSLQERFEPLSKGVPLMGSGPVWIRLVLIKNPPPGPLMAPALDKRRLVLNLGKLPPGQTTVYFSDAPGPSETAAVWHTETVTAYEDVPLPEPGLLPVNVFVRMDETPGLWFAPTVSAKDVKRPDLLPPELLLPGLLIAAAIVCLLRAMAERASWAFWSALFLLSAVGQAVLPLSSPGRGLHFADLPALLAPGMGLILLPHIGRCMFRTDKSGHFQDVVLYLSSLMGLALSLAPLVPGFGWLTRLFPLTPLLFAPLLPLCLGALSAKRPGSLAFAGATIMPFLGACAALYALKGPGLDPLAIPLMAQGGLWGMVVGGIGLALARIPKPVRTEEQEQADQAGLMLAESAAEEARAEAVDKGVDLEKTPAFAPQGQYDALPPLPVSPVQDREQKAPPLDMDITAIHSPEEEPEPAPADAASGQRGVKNGFGVRHETEERQDGTNVPETSSGLASMTDDAPGIRDSGPEMPGEPEPAAPEDVAELSEELPAGGAEEPEQHQPRESAALEETPSGAGAFGPGGTAPLASYPSVLPDFAATSDSLPHDERSRIISLVEENFSNYPLALMEELRNEPSRYISLTPDGGFLFNLHSLVREVHDIVAPFAKTRGLIFSWYIAPSLPVLLEGDAPRLRGALSLLLQNAVMATRHGAVQLAVRRQPDAESLGDLLFTISDNGSAQRTDAGFFHAWELAARTGGAFTVDYSPTSGTRISFSVRFALPSEEAARAHLAHHPLPANGLAEEGGKVDEQASTLTAPYESDEPVPVLHAVQPQRHALARAAEITPAEAAWLASVSPSPAFADGASESDEAQQASDSESVAPAAMAAPGEMPLERAVSDFLADLEPAAATEPRLLHPELSRAERDVPVGAGRAQEPDVPHLQERPCIVAAEMTTSKRRLLAHYLQDLPHEQCNAATHAQVIDLLKAGPVSLFIFDGDMPEPDMAKTMAAIRKEEAAAGLRGTPILVMTSHEGQSGRLLEAGATHALVKPFQREALLETVALAVPALAPFVPGRQASDPAAANADDEPPVGTATAAPPRDLFEHEARETEPAPFATLSDSVYAGFPEESVQVESASYELPETIQPASPEDGPAPEPALSDSSRGEEGLAEQPLIQDVPPVGDRSFQEEPVAADTARIPPDRRSPSRPVVVKVQSLKTLPPEEETVGRGNVPHDLSATDGPGPEGRQTGPEAIRTEDAERGQDRKRHMNKPIVVQMQPRKAAPSVESARPVRRDAAFESGESSAGPQAWLEEKSLRDTTRDQTATAPKRAPVKPVVVRVPSPVRRVSAEQTPTLSAEVAVHEDGLPDAAPPREAAPMIMGLSAEDVTPVQPDTLPETGKDAARETLPADKNVDESSDSRAGLSRKGSLLDYVLTDGGSEKESASPSGEAALEPSLVPVSPPAVSAEKAEAQDGAAPFQADATPSWDGALEETVAAAEPAGNASLTAPAAEENVSGERQPPGMESAPEDTAADVAQADISCSDGAVQEQGTEQEAASGDGRTEIGSPLYPLPGIKGEALDVSMLPLAPGLVYALNDTLAETLAARESGSPILAQDAASRLAAKAEHFGLEKLGRIARCVERAAQADDMEAVATLLEDLEPVTKRYIEAVQACFQSFLDIDR